MSVYRMRRYVCEQCDAVISRLAWDYQPAPTCGQHGAMVEDGAQRVSSHGVVDDTIIGGRWCETLGHEPVWIESNSQLRREAEKRNLVNVVRHTEEYYARQRKHHDEWLRDTGQKH